MKKWLLPIGILLLSACTDGPTREDVIRDVKERSGYTVSDRTPIGKIMLPPGTSLEDGISEDEAVAIALWNNAAFQEVLTDLDIAHGDLLQAGLLPNPVGSYTLSANNKAMKYAFEFPLEALWLRPFRIRAARADAEKVSHQLSQAGLNLIRDTRRAYSDMQQAQRQQELWDESLALRRRIATMAGKRLEAGDISKQEANVANLDALAAEQNAAQSHFDIKTAEERLRYAMGVGSFQGALELDPIPTPQCRTTDIEVLVSNAIRNRPDALASKSAIVAAQQRANLSLFGWLGITGVADAGSGRKTGHELSPGIKGALPVFNQNQGNIERSSGEEEKARRNEESVAQQIRLEVKQSYMQYRQACTQLDILQTKVKAGVETDLTRIEKAYASGDVPYLMVLQASHAVIDAQLRESQLVGDVRRTGAELERSVGTRVNPEIHEPVSAPRSSTGKEKREAAHE